MKTANTSKCWEKKHSRKEASAEKTWPYLEETRNKDSTACSKKRRKTSIISGNDEITLIRWACSKIYYSLLLFPTFCWSWIFHFIFFCCAHLSFSISFFSHLFFHFFLFNMIERPKIGSARMHRRINLEATTRIVDVCLPHFQ